MKITDVIQRFVIVFALSFTLGVLLLMAFWQPRGTFFLPMWMFNVLILLSALLAGLSFIYVGYTKDILGLVWRSILHYVLLLGAIATWFYIYTDYVLMPHQIFNALLVYTGVYGAGWILIYLFGLSRNNQLNRDLKAYRDRHPVQKNDSQSKDE